MAAYNRQAVNWLGNAWAQVILNRAQKTALPPGTPFPDTVEPALIDFWTAMADPVVECFERYLTPEDDG